jgi:hypothetical protein
MVSAKPLTLRVLHIQNTCTVRAANYFIAAHQSICRLCGKRHKASAAGVNSASVILHFDFRDCLAVISIGNPFENFQRLGRHLACRLLPVPFNIGYLVFELFRLFFGLFANPVQFVLGQFDLLFNLVALNLVGVDIFHQFKSLVFYFAVVGLGGIKLRKYRRVFLVALGDVQSRAVLGKRLVYAFYLKLEPVCLDFRQLDFFLLGLERVLECPELVFFYNNISPTAR